MNAQLDKYINTDEPTGARAPHQNCVPARNNHFLAFKWHRQTHQLMPVRQSRRKQVGTTVINWSCWNCSSLSTAPTNLDFDPCSLIKSMKVTRRRRLISIDSSFMKSTKDGTLAQTKKGTLNVYKQVVAELRYLLA
ncbi:hypothetical protein BLNAU_4358 [Blattamonas nauphoetae]|uniref:Uncharacterized protein n=1 Tax=Blattamonas nauphoetae TaxID=2049346 RepID=A0ABQ9WRX2_9EUKA|nr:hypothetical protein BLNAU_22855 [Blattamonas nauphoetae]KAK2946377.1 hypothetical protein BLNAU_18738 [Blattamonas nauphoetae]KAK2953393.1 hypothetical protein BLNAU_11679 [Blattamonas nauphoetae]KAK2960266.1 hypothetical protein BLNAU_4819 [Blattamonas nauphoetae]KAK2960703.1 hypothetical protein BLNAU_4358 [Blattamonas nauphoetae]